MSCPHCGDTQIWRYGRRWAAPRSEIVRSREYVRYCPVESCPSCHHALEPIETPAAAAEVSRPPVRQRRSHRRGFVALSPTH